VTTLKTRVSLAINSLGFSLRRVQKLSEDGELALYSDLFGHDAVTGRRFYNLGAGSFSHPCWTNVDHPSAHYANAQSSGGIHLPWDAIKGEPLGVASDSAELMYSSHVIEHLPNEAGTRLIAEAYRCLKPGGVFRVSTIDVDLDYRAFQTNDRRYFNWIDMYSKSENMARACIAEPLNEASIHQIFLFHFASSASELHIDGVANPISDHELDQFFKTLPYEEALDACSARCSLDVQLKYPGNHLTWWNGSKLLNALREAGFGEVYLSGNAQSRSPVLRDLRFFDKTRPTTSVYAEAVK
jgi:predicted SAM-dependent methyltransferase